MKQRELSQNQISWLKAFRDEVCLQPWANELDADFFALSIGFFLAKGASCEEACDLAVFARYDCQYFDGSVEVQFAV